MKSFITRFISAAVAVLVILFTFYFFQTNGLKFLILAAFIIATTELQKILFKNKDQFFASLLFSILSIFNFLLIVYIPNFALYGICFTWIFYVISTLMLYHKSKELDLIQSSLFSALVGFIYLPVFVSFAWRILDLENGLQWFIGLLTMVFAGDIGAYLVGVLIGKNKIMPSISPKKSIEGAVGGLLSSSIAGLAFGHSLTQQYLIIFSLLGLIVGLVGMFGDFFESLLKRVANIKDSGSIMPGHGGVLDRIDGVIFAAPVVFLAAYFGPAFLASYF